MILHFLLTFHVNIDYLKLKIKKIPHKNKLLTYQKNIKMKTKRRLKIYDVLLKEVGEKAQNTPCTRKVFYYKKKTLFQSVL